MDALRDVAITIGTICGAILGMAAVIAMIGRWWWNSTIEPRLAKLDAGQSALGARLMKIEEQVTMNGARKLLPEDMRDLPLADIVVMHVIESVRNVAILKSLVEKVGR